LPIVDRVVKSVRTGDTSVHDALQEAERLAQQEVDKLRS
jgi:hypothetical protein